MHIEDSLRIAIEEKDDLINVLKTQVRRMCLLQNPLARRAVQGY